MTFERITSVKNPLIQLLKGLRDKQGRAEHGLFAVEGEVMMREALDAGLTVAFVLVEDARMAAYSALVDRCVAAGAEVHPVSEHVLAAVCDTRTPQGVLGAFSMPEARSQMPARLVALDGVQDPGNVGTIWRTADAVGFQGLLLGPGCADPFSPKTQRAAMGSGFRVPVWTVEDLAESLTRLKAEGYVVVASTLTGDVFERGAVPGERVALIVGSEAHGIGAAVEAAATHRVKLPMRGGAQSLNAAIAAGILMYALMDGRGAG